MLWQQIADGVVLGCIYALSALGFTLIYGAARVINFAYGEFMMLGAYFTLIVMAYLGMPFFVALPISMTVDALLNVLVFTLALRPVMRGSLTSFHGELQIILITLGFFYILREVALLVWGTSPRQMDMGVSGIVLIGNVLITDQRLVVVGIVIALVVILYGLLYRTKIGGAIRAIAQNREGALAIGLNIDRTIAFVFAISGAMACAAGSLLGTLYAVAPDMGGRRFSNLLWL